MENIKSFIKMMKADKRKRALMSLVLWFLFLVLVYILMGGFDAIPSEIGTGSKYNNKQNISSNSLSNFENMNNYEYTYEISTTINNISNTYKISGTYYNNNNYFDFDNNKYVIQNENIYFVDEENSTLTNIINIKNDKLSKIMDFRLLNKTNFATFLTSSEEVTKTSYKDGSSKRTLVYKSADGKEITFVTSEYGNIINGIDINFVKYFSHYSNFNVVVELKNINNIDEFNTDYSKYKIIEKGE